MYLEFRRELEDGIPSLRAHRKTLSERVFLDSGALFLGADPEDWIGDRERRVQDGPPPNLEDLLPGPRTQGHGIPGGFGETCGLRKFEAPKSFERRETSPHLLLQHNDTAQQDNHSNTAKASDSFDKTDMMQTQITMMAEKIRAVAAAALDGL
jgi:hypothetical protein